MRRVVALTAVVAGCLAAAAPASAADATFELKSARKLAAFTKTGYPFQGIASEPVTYAAAVFVPKRVAQRWGIAKKTVSIGEASGAVPAGGFSGKLRPVSKWKRKLRGLLDNDRFRRLPIVFQAVMQDGAGNVTSVKKKLELKR